MIRRFSRRHPRSVAAFVVLAFAVSLLLPFILSDPIDLTDGTGFLTFDAMTAGIVSQALLTVILFGIIAALGWTDITGMRGPVDRGGLKSFYWLAALPVLGCVVLGISLFWLEGEFEPALVLFFVLSLNLFVGLSEELLFRGIVFGALRQRYQLITAIVISSLVFGLAHMPNLGVGQSLPLTLYQVINAIILGALFCAVVLQTNSIWPAVLLHMMWNTYVMLGQFVIETITPHAPSEWATLPVFTFAAIVPLVIMFWITLVLLRTYTLRTGQVLRRAAPSYTVDDHLSA